MNPLLALAPILLQTLEVRVEPAEAAPALVSAVGPAGFSPVDLRLDNILWETPLLLPAADAETFSPGAIAPSTAAPFPADRWLEIAAILPDALGRVTIGGRELYGGSAYHRMARQLGRTIASEGFTDDAMQEAARLRDAAPR